jgi:hypothetical protein
MQCGALKINHVRPMQSRWYITVKQSAILFNLMPDCEIGEASKLTANILITKEPINITHETNMYRATKEVPPMRVSW